MIPSWEGRQVVRKPSAWGGVLKLNPLSEDETLDPQTPADSHNHYADKVWPHFHTASNGILYNVKPELTSTWVLDICGQEIFLVIWISKARKGWCPLCGWLSVACRETDGFLFLMRIHSSLTFPTLPPPCHPTHWHPEPKRHKLGPKRNPAHQQTSNKEYMYQLS